MINLEHLVKKMIVFLIGLVVVLFGVGGVEASVNNVQLVAGVVVSCFGLALMDIGVKAVRYE